MSQKKSLLSYLLNRTGDNRYWFEKKNSIQKQIAESRICSFLMVKGYFDWISPVSTICFSFLRKPRVIRMSRCQILKTLDFKTEKIYHRSLWLTPQPGLNCSLPPSGTCCRQDMQAHDTAASSTHSFHHSLRCERRAMKCISDLRWPGEELRFRTAIYRIFISQWEKWGENACEFHHTQLFFLSPFHIQLCKTQ